MKKSKLLISSAILAPLTVLPTVLTTSCSVYVDLMKGYTPSYQPYSDKTQLSEEEATKVWFDFIDTSKFRDEFMWSTASTGQAEYTYEYETVGVTYKAKFTNLLINWCYCNIDKDTHKVSYKYTGEATTESTYTQKSTSKLLGTGKETYSFNFEIKNMEFTLYWSEEPLWSQPSCFSFVPLKAKESLEWTTQLTGDEEIAFNNRVVSEIYNSENKQQYRIETIEGALIDEKSPLSIELSWLVDDLVWNWSYYLKEITK